MTTPVDIGDDDPARSFVYFISNTSANLVKVGFSKNIGKRFIDLQTSAGAKLHLSLYFGGDRATEKAIHQFLASERTYGEWFDASEKTLTLLDEIADFLAKEDDDREYWDHVVTADDIGSIVTAEDYGGMG